MPNCETHADHMGDGQSGGCGGKDHAMTCGKKIVDANASASKGDLPAQTHASESGNLTWKDAAIKGSSGAFYGKEL